MVMGGDSSFKGHEFESRQPYNGWTFFHIHICCKICNVFEKTKKMKKRPGLGHFLKKL